MRTMLIIGATREDAYAFVGQVPDAPPGNPSAPDRPSLLVPENVWPAGEVFTGYFMAARVDGVPKWPVLEGRPPFGLVIVTRGALYEYGATPDDVRAWAADLLDPDGGMLYVQPTEAAPVTTTAIPEDPDRRSAPWSA